KFGHVHRIRAETQNWRYGRRSRPLLPDRTRPGRIKLIDAALNFLHLMVDVCQTVAPEAYEISPGRVVALLALDSEFELTLMNLLRFGFVSFKRFFLDALVFLVGFAQILIAFLGAF